ncbi:MAG TPA: heme-binding protein [Xanthobacteraceae bacterium]|nr:heme-binding protein [Xanthobacteraceae bacterium]
MKPFWLSRTQWAAILALTMLGVAGWPAAAQAPAAPAPTAATALISLAEARAIIQAAEDFARGRHPCMAVVVVDQVGNVVSSDRMDACSPSNVHLAEGKAFASVMFRQTTEALGELAKLRPDRYFGILNMYPGRVYLVGGGEPLVVDGRIVGAVGVAGLPQGVDELAGRAGIAAWEALRAKTTK